MDTKHEALELAETMEKIGGAISFGAAALLRRQHTRIEELERALQEISDEAGPSLGSNFGTMSRIGRIARDLLTKKD